MIFRSITTFSERKCLKSFIKCRISFFYNPLRTKTLKMSVQLFFVFCCLFRRERLKTLIQMLNCFRSFIVFLERKPHRSVKLSYFSFFSCIFERLGFIDLDRNSLYLETWMAFPLYILILDYHPKIYGSITFWSKIH